MLLRILFIILLVLFIVVLGFVVGRRIKPDLSVMNRLNLDIFCPFLVFAALAAKDFDLFGNLNLLAGGVLIVLGSGLLSWIATRWLKVDTKTFLPPMMFNNCGNMGLPLAVLAFGAAGLSPAVALFVASNALHFMIGPWLVSGRLQWRAIIGSPMIWATVAGFGVSALKIEVPLPLMQAIKMVGDVAIPLMLFALGVRMLDLKFRNWREPIVGAILCPVSGLIVALLIYPYLGLKGSQLGLLFLFAALPPAVLNFIVAEKYQQEPALVASMVLIGNVAALVFVPLGLWLGLRAGGG